jgi:hypothetical protein
MEVRRGEVEVQVEFTPDADYDPLEPSPVSESGSGDE